MTRHTLIMWNTDTTPVSTAAPVPALGPPVALDAMIRQSLAGTTTAPGFAMPRPRPRLTEPTIPIPAPTLVIRDYGAAADDDDEALVPARGSGRSGRLALAFGLMAIGLGVYWASRNPAFHRAPAAIVEQAPRIEPPRPAPHPIIIAEAAPAEPAEAPPVVEPTVAAPAGRSGLTRRTAPASRPRRNLVWSDRAQALIPTIR